MNNSSTLNESLHSIELLSPRELFLEKGKPCYKIGRIRKGVMRGFVDGDSGEEITTHFYQEGDMVVGSWLPNVAMSMTIQALEHCEVSIANYFEVMSQVNRNLEITSIITREFQKLNQQLQSRLVSLLNLDAAEKYALFLKNYPGLTNRIPNYYIARYLGITPTQLSRVRKNLSTNVNENHSSTP